MKISRKFEEILLQFHKWNRKNWLIVSILLSTSSIWFSLILNYGGEYLGLLNNTENGKSITIKGWILTGIVVLFSAFVVMAQRYYEYKELNNNKDKSELDILRVINDSTNELCDSKCSKIRKEIFKIKNGEEDLPKIISDPTEQIKQMIKKLNDSLSILLSYEGHKINKDEMYTCLHYNFPLENNKWYLSESFYSERNIKTEELLEESSTFKDVLNAKEDFIFYNSKEKAKTSGKYIQDDQDQLDEEKKLKGSIACYRILVKYRDETYVNAVLSFVTYSKKFVDTEDINEIETVKYNVKKCILEPFKKRFNIELCLLYLFKLSESNKAKLEELIKK